MRPSVCRASAAACALLVVGCAARALAQTPSGRPDVATTSAAAVLSTDQGRAVRIAVEQPIVVDGVLDETAWAGAPIIGGFLQRDPSEGQPASEKTEIRVIYSGSSIYFGIICFDSEPSRITATELRRDNNFDNDDVLSILLDTLHDHRSAYLFRVNPAGTQSDALITDEGKVTDTNWDESWRSAGRITDTGWTAEVEIPFKILRLSGNEEQVWGIDFERIIRRKSEFTYWHNYRRGFLFAQVSQAGHLTGLREVTPGMKVRIKPFARTSLRNSSAVAVGHKQTALLSDIGLEDVKYRINSNFIADFTVNTDFAEADVDAQVLNVTRFPVFFPEKREFFVEGAGIFDYGPGGGSAAEIKLFFSRNIGLSSDRETIPIIAGAKVTGKANGWSVGVLDVQTDELGVTPSRNFAVVRIKKDLFARSNVGLIATNRTSITTGDPYNRSVGLDGNFVFLEHLNVQTFAASTFTPGKPDDHFSGRIRTYWDTDRFLINGEHLLIQRDVNPEMGWLPRRDMRKSRAQFDYKPRPSRSSEVRQFFLRSSLDYITNQAGTLETRNRDGVFETLFQSGDRVILRFTDIYDRIRRPFTIQNRVIVPPGVYTWEAAQLRFQPSSNRIFSGEIGLRQQWGFYGGDSTEFVWAPLWKPSENLSIAPAYQFTHLDLPGGRFSSHLVNSQFNYAFSNRWLTSTTLQYNNLTRFAVGNVRLNFIYRPGDDFFLIYNDSATLETMLTPGIRNRSIIAKLTRSFDF